MADQTQLDEAQTSDIDATVTRIVKERLGEWPVRVQYNAINTLIASLQDLASELREQIDAEPDPTDEPVYGEDERDGD